MDKRNAIKMAISLKNRHRSENRFKIASYLAILFSISFLFIMIVSIVLKGYSAFFSTKIAMEIDVNSESQSELIRFVEKIKNSLHTNRIFEKQSFLLREEKNDYHSLLLLL